MKKKKTRLKDDGAMKIVITIPKNSVRVRLSALVADKDGKIKKAVSSLTFDDIRKLRKEFVENIGDDYGTEFFLTEKGKQLVSLYATPEGEVGM